MLRCSVSRVGPVGLVTRAGAHGEAETLVRSVGGLGFVPLEGATQLAAFGCGTHAAAKPTHLPLAAQLCRNPHPLCLNPHPHTWRRSGAARSYR